MSDAQVPTLAYAFAHIYLRDIVLQKDIQFLQVFQQGPIALGAYMKASWNGLRSANPEIRFPFEVTNEHFRSTLLRVNDSQTLLAIEFPKPEELTEVFMVGIVLGDKPRYFTLEKGVTESGSEFAAVCEWTSEGHRHFGVLSEPTVEKFGGRVNVVLKEESNARTIS